LKKKRVKKIIDWSLFGFLLVVLAGVVVPLFPEAPYALKMVTSNSMRPAFSTGSLVVVIPEEHYEVGQVITYQASEYEEDIVTHRIIGQKEGGFITKGDANKIEDEKPVFQSQIQGRVAFYLPLVGYLISFFQRPIGFVLIYYLWRN